MLGDECPMCRRTFGTDPAFINLCEENSMNQADATAYEVAIEFLLNKAEEQFRKGRAKEDREEQIKGSSKMHVLHKLKSTWNLLRWQKGTIWKVEEEWRTKPPGGGDKKQDQTKESTNETKKD